MLRNFKRALTVLVVLAVASAATGRPTSPWLAAGSPAPPVSLSTADGRSMTLDPFRGRAPVLLWFTNFSPGAFSSVSTLSQISDQFHSRGLQIIAVSVNPTNPGASADFSNQFGKFITVVSDPNGRACQAFTGEYLPGVAPMRNLFIIGRDGIIHSVRRFPGCPPRVLAGDLTETP